MGYRKNNFRDREDELEDDGALNQKSAIEQYGEDMLRKPKYKLIGIGLGRLYHSISLIEDSWQNTKRSHSLKELDNVLHALHELENKTGDIEDPLLRGYIHEQLDMIAAQRRSLAEDIKWDVEAKSREDAFNQALKPVADSDGQIYAEIAVLNEPHDVWGT